MKDVKWKEYVDKRFEGEKEARSVALASAKEAVNAALVSSEKAVDKAEANTREWQKSANEWRGAMNDKDALFLTRKEFYTMVATAVIVISLVIGFLKFYK